MVEKKAESADGRGLLGSYTATLLDTLRWRVLIVLGLMILVGLTEGIGLLLLLPLMGLVGLDVQQGNIGRLAEIASSFFAATGLHPTLITVLFIYIAITCSHALLSRRQTISSLALGYEFVDHLRRQIYEAIMNAGWIFLSKSRASDFTHALTSELDRVYSATYSLLFLISNSTIALVYIALAVRLSTAMSALVFACGAALLFLLKGKVRASRVNGEEYSRISNEMYAATIEHLGALKTIKSYNAEERTGRMFSSLIERVTKVSVEGTRDYADLRLWFEIGSVLVLSLIVYIAFKVLSLPTAEVLLLLFVFARIMPRLSNIQQNYQQFINLLPSFATVKKMQERCEAASENKVAETQGVSLTDSLQLENVSFRYDEDGKDIICDLSLDIPAGQTTAIVGPSGAGKSTIADLIIGLVTPTEGCVLIDRTPLRAGCAASWRDQIGYVTQDTFLFHDTVRANLVWACPLASDEEINKALRLAAAEDFVSALPEGIETILGDRGARLSGGERQRLALARAILRKPSLLILDEATSALDSENERRIQGAIENLHGRITILIITHRLSTILNADMVYVLEGGRLVESGNGNSLMAKQNGRFRDLCIAQNLIGAIRTPDFDLKARLKARE